MEEEIDQPRLPICRLVMLVAAIVIMLTSYASGVQQPFDIFLRVVIGSVCVGVVIFFVNLWFSTLFL